MLLILAAGVLVTVACSSDTDARQTAGAGQSTASAEASLAPLTKAQLKALTFKEGEVPQVREGGIALQEFETKSGRPSFPPVSDPSCNAMVDIRIGENASVVVSQSFDWEGDIYAGSSIIASYKQGEARKVFAELEQALGACRSYSGGNYAGKFKAAVKVEKDPSVGDEAARFREIVPIKDLGDRDMEFTLVRSGNVIVTFQRMNIGGSSSFPEELIGKQVERLHEAQRK
ncbi:hypothetical protein O3Q52_03590 [Streptomyces sp. ActVer]|uniref:hypothetical protein n=1 Tax=Streptomyces sp. ActVer TaxID=3014558 RepID=UPI0022B39378|nr:hypothetical protein [Streptomyces sp. ActVer]MCZ4507302.1 hypothetical protein [Streptomyces sp. ActVer]